MDFVSPFPESNGCDYLWVVICCLTSMVHLVPIKTTMTASKLAWLYMHEIIRLYGLVETIVSDRDSKFTLRFWRETHKLLGMKLLMSTLFHPQMDGTLECVICSVAQILQALVHPDQCDWGEKIPMVEFTLNSALSSSSGFAPFELNYGYIPSINLGFKLEPSCVPSMQHFVECVLRNLTDAYNTIIESCVCQTHHANRRHCKDDSFAVGDLIFVSTADLSLPKGHTVKLLPKYIGPFKVLDANPSTSSYRIELLTQLWAWHLHDWFHHCKLRPYHVNDDTLFPHQEAHMFYNFGTPDDQEWLVDKIVDHMWDTDHLLFQIHWNMGDSTWESFETCRDLQALNDYLHLLGIDDPFTLPRTSS
jgi:hypothetical protein